MKAIKCETRANILVTQPRRVAATSLAMRVSNERCSPSPGSDGSEVGYNVRLSKAISDSTKITYCTVGILLRMLVNPIQDEDGNGNGNNDGADEDESGDSKDTIKNQKTPPVPLSHISHVIIDEVHERDLNTDFALTLLRPLLCANKNISVILMSATASSELFVNYFRSYKLNIEPKVFKIPGRTFPVETKWLSHCEKIVSKGLNGWSNDFINEDESSRSKKIESDVILSPRATAKIDNDFITDLIKILSKQQWEKDKSKCNGKATTEKDSGAILVFLPGKGEIQALVKTLSNDSSLGDRKRCSILQLHSSLSPREQWLAFQPVKYGIVKVILATNVAETSITIPDVSTVIDTGRVKESRFNSSTRIRELVTVWTSQASVKQRAGRAGRTGPGICYKLYSEEFTQKMMLPQTPPEIVRTPLEELVLQVCLMKEHEHSKGTSPMKFLSQAPEPPSESRLSEACDHLLQIGALSPNITEDESIFRLTPLGYHLAHLPMDPKVGKVSFVQSYISFFFC
jgi:ATP-dependent RNA helicase DHX57